MEYKYGISMAGSAKKDQLVGSLQATTDSTEKQKHTPALLDASFGQ